MSCRIGFIVTEGRGAMNDLRRCTLVIKVMERRDALREYSDSIGRYGEDSYLRRLKALRDYREHAGERVDDPNVFYSSQYDDEIEITWQRSLDHNDPWQWYAPRIERYTPGDKTNRLWCRLAKAVEWHFYTSPVEVIRALREKLKANPVLRIDELDGYVEVELDLRKAGVLPEEQTAPVEQVEAA